MNVAISRAQCLAVVVADPRIAGAIPRLAGRNDADQPVLQIGTGLDIS